jgi:hypothetical protein
MWHGDDRARAIATCVHRRHVKPRRAAVSPWLVVAGWAGVLSALLLWPITRAGYLLGHDMVFTPQQPLDLASIGVSSAPPRAVPLDALVAMAEYVVDGAVVARLALLLPLIAAGVGAAVLLDSRVLAARLAACSFAIWNPFVVERLALGQWALVWGYAALPWLIVAISRGRGRGRWLATAAALAAASITPTGGLVATVTAGAVTTGLRRGRRELAATLGLSVVLQLPWLIPAVVTTASATSDPAAVAAFSARAEHSGGVLLSLLGGGGIWDAEVVPDSRGGAPAWLGLAVLVAAAAFGARRLTSLLGARLMGTLAVLSAAGLLLAVLPSVPGGDALVRAAIAHVPGTGLVRDAQKWIVPLVLFAALLTGAAVERVAQRVRAEPLRALLVVAVLAVPIILLPDAPATLRPSLDPVHYPRDWASVDQRLGDGDGDVAVLPFGSYRTFPWASGRSVLDPAPRLLSAPTVVDDRLVVSGRRLQGEDVRARAVAAALDPGRDLPRGLARNGITWVLVERDTPGQVPDLSGLDLRYAGSSLALYRVPGPITRVHVSAARIVAVLAGDVLAVVVLLALAACTVSGWRRGRHPVTGDEGPETSIRPPL